jgi:ligand-binding sensor protein
MQTTYVRSASGSRSSVNPGQTPSGRSRARTTQGTSGATGGKSAPYKSRASGGTNSDRSLIEALVNSKVFQDYERAFTEATGLPVVLRPSKAGSSVSWPAKRRAVLLDHFRTKPRVRHLPDRAGETSNAATDDPVTLSCPSGLCETAVPIRLGDRVIGFLQTGQVFRKKPTEAQFQRS